MILFRHIILTFFFLVNLCYADTFGYLKEVEVSICMDECSQYMLVDEDDNFIAYLINMSNLNLSYYIGRYVQVGSESEEQYQCITGCSAIIIETINLSDECTMPVQCFADPCLVAPECELNTPVDCISNYCGGCYADFYDLEGNLVDCYTDTIDGCTDLQDIEFGLCDMWMGYALINGNCQGVSGCGWFINGIDYSDAFFASLSECEQLCEHENSLSCSEIEMEYALIHSGEYNNCSQDSDCLSIWGDCSVGLGGCHYSVNDSVFNYEYSGDLVDMWVSSNCMAGVCDCMDLPNSICMNGECQLTYCDGPNPSGCFSSGCQDGYQCLDFGNQDYPGFCVSSSCYCDENFFGESTWICTEDCNGGTCIPEDPQPGDLCVFDYNLPGLHWPGFVDCHGECLEYEYNDWLGDGWCDDGWGYSFNCEALNFDNGDCQNNCTSGDENDDGILNVLDIILIVGCILDDENVCPCSDINQDGTINVIDIVIITNIIIDP